MTIDRRLLSGLRLLALLVWSGLAVADGAEPPASGPVTGAGKTAVAPLLEAPALPSAASPRFIDIEGTQDSSAGSPAGPAAAQAAPPTSLHLPGAVLDPTLRLTLHPYLSLLEQLSNRTRGPPLPVG